MIIVASMRATIRFGLSCILMAIMSLKIYSQDVSIKLGNPNIGLNQYFTITIIVENDRLSQYSRFPEIKGFIKRGTSSSTTTNFINGQMTSSQSLTQNYQAGNKGNFQLPPFYMKINGKEAKSQGTQIVVGEPVKQRRRNAFFSDPFENFFSRKEEASEFIDIEADAFLAITTDKQEVYIGEGFTATLAFYVSETNRADMRFYDLGSQITEIVKRLKPASCWEENFPIDNISGEPIQLGDKNYTRYRIYQTTFFPLNVEDISFSSVGLKMIKYKVAKNPSFFGANRQEDYETFYSRKKTVKVMELPPHPLKEQISVGDYQLKESLSAEEVQTGESLNYEFTLFGEGNISAIEAPRPQSDTHFDFYAPNVRQSINKNHAKVMGNKSYHFYAIPNEPGEYPLKDYFSWIFFNPFDEKYDTLQSKLTLKVSGESRKNQYIASNDIGDFYDQIRMADNALTPMDENLWMTWLIRAFVVLMIGFTTYLLVRKTAP